MYSLKKLFNVINLNIKSNRIVKKNENGLETIVECNNKPIAINYNADLVVNRGIIFNTQSNIKDCSFYVLEKYIQQTLSLKINLIFNMLLNLIYDYNLYSQIKSQKLKDLLMKLIKKDLINFDDGNVLLDKWKNINNKFPKNSIENGLINLLAQIGKICVEDVDEIQYLKKKYKLENDEDSIFVYINSYILVEFPLYNLLKEAKNKLFGVEFDKNELEILTTLYEFIFENIEKKNFYSYSNVTLLKDKLQEKEIKNLTIIDPIKGKSSAAISLIESFNSLAKHIDNIFDEISDIDKETINNLKFNLNLTKEEIDDIKSLNKFVPKEYLGSMNDLKNEIKFNSRVKLEELNEQLNLTVVKQTANKIDKQKYRSPTKAPKTTHYLSPNAPSRLLLSLGVSSMITSVDILDPDDVNFKEMLPDKERQRHTYILAGSGSGKTSLLESFIYSHCKNIDQSTIIFDLMGKATNSVLKFVKDSNRVIIVDPYLHPIITPIINPFEFLNEDGTTKENPSEIEIENRTNAIISAFDIALNLKDGWSINMRAVLAPCISTLLRKGGSDIFELQRFMNDEINNDLIELGRDSPIEGHSSFFFKEFNKESYEITRNAISTKLQVFLNDPTFTNLVTGKSTINLQKEINTAGKIIIFKLPSKQKIFARLMMEMIQDIMRERINISEDKIVPTHIYLDEFQNYLAPTIEEILSESRNYKFYVTFAHQSFVQLSKKMQGIVLSNSNIKIVGQCSYDNGKKMAKEIKADFEMIETLDQGEFVFKVGASNVFKAKNTDKFIKNKTPYHNNQRTKHMKHQFKNYYVYKKPISLEDTDNIIGTTKLTPKYDEF